MSTRGLTDRNTAREAEAAEAVGSHSRDRERGVFMASGRRTSSWVERTWVKVMGKRQAHPWSPDLIVWLGPDGVTCSWFAGEAAGKPG